uniref:Betaine--homocysteine S-methyltransferase n=1 Tax=Myotis myotis TaxID=51298 RepID=A0A7J7XYC4_MYOMY|nr:betaine--homocysteine S-methyltransferase [Myotis myotis]
MAPIGGKKAKKGILERLNSGEVVIGDGGFVFSLEKRGYVKAGPWTPEAAVEHPEAGWCLALFQGWERPAHGPYKACKIIWSGPSKALGVS